MKVQSRRPHIEDALELSLSDLTANDMLAPYTTVYGTLRWKRRSGLEQYVAFVSDIDKESGTLLLNYKVPRPSDAAEKNIGCLITISSTTRHFGGRRFWMHCPYTGRRATKLYKFAEVDYFCHRTAISPAPTYASQRVSGLDRIQNQRQRLRRLLKFRGGSYDVPSKPKWMRWKTYLEYCSKDARLTELDIDRQLQWVEKVKAKRRF